MNSFSLRIQTDRYGMDRVIRQDRNCNMCSNEAEDENHSGIKCPLYDDIRRRFFLNRNIYTRPSMKKCISLKVIIRIF